jgi:16S rRNA (adenine1518-N6/adenine1519-N6)-dimethyltransferase
MLQKEIKKLLKIYNVFPRKKLGQHFLCDDEILHKMVSYASLSDKDIVLEIGAGFGLLTELIAKKAKHVFSVEIDPKLATILKKRLYSYRNISIIQNDIRKISLPPFDKIISTPPYYLSSFLLFWLLKKKFKIAILAFQEEFARRLAASSGSEHYGRLTVNTYYQAEVELRDIIHRSLFWPEPKVNSMIVYIKPRNSPFLIEDKEAFKEIVKMIFTQKNKKLRSAIKPYFKSLKIPKKEMLEIVASLPLNNKRPRELTPEEIGLISNVVMKKISARA